jgi:hypothetical protein
MAMEAPEVLAIEDCVERMMSADASEICPLADKAVELVQRLNRAVWVKQADITGILPEEDATGASITGRDGPATEEEEHVGDDDLGGSSVSEEEEQNEHRRIGFLDGNGELLPEIDADLANARPDRRRGKQRKIEEQRLGRLFGSGYMQWKLNQRGGVADLARQLAALPRTLRNWKKALNKDPTWRPWAPRVSSSERNRNRKVSDDMADVVRRRIRDEFIAGHRPLTAPALMPIFRATWEMTHGPEEPWPGVDVRTIRRFPRRNRMG